MAAQDLDRDLNAGPSSSSNTPKTTVVNDLTSKVVKKKKKVALADSNTGKRKADEEAESLNVDKKPKLESADQ